jgi:hypothetical protein
MFVSVDDVSVIGTKMGTKVEVITNKEADKHLRSYSNNLETGVSSKDEKGRVATFNCSITGGGKLLCVVFKWYDEKFQETEPYLVKMNSDWYWVALYGPNSKATIDEIIYKRAIIPSAEKMRTDFKETRNVDAFEEKLSRTSSIRTAQLNNSVSMEPLHAAAGGELSLAAGADVANKVPKFADILMKECFIADHCYEEMLCKEFLESVDDIGNSRVGKRPLEQLSTSRQRAGFFGKLITGTPFKSLATSAICASNDTSSGGGGGGVAAAADASSAASVSNLQDTPATKTKKVYVKNVLCMYCNTPGKSNHPEWRKCSKAKCNQMHCCGSDACVKHFQEHCNACTKK